ncbi:hypothetical protein [Streptomyces sp. YU58]|uniref:hypothetical protein n=1 Tax=Streptomyces sp. SX92 TaxID=3158972 RepID=UPI0027BAD9D8|nr:hypothetical protein [Streptomyces coralus]WLW51794.1 hypothetical protein QU709_10580 [Streptomyces coralus]
MARPAVGWRTWGARGAGLGFGALWWWAVLRLALSPDAGVLEGAVAAGGWGLSLLPVHCVPKARAVGAVEAGRWGAAWRGTSSPGAGAGAGAGGGAWPDRGVRGESGGVTRAWSRRRWGGGSGPL